MFVKLIISLNLIVAIFGIPIEYQEYEQQQSNRGHHEQDYEKSYQPAEYDYNYSVHDEHTGDIKSHRESRKGDDVQGQYEFIEADGYRRIVQYTANKNGFNAVVHREPTDYIEHNARQSATAGHSGSLIGQNSGFNQYNQQTPSYEVQ